VTCDVSPSNSAPNKSKICNLPPPPMMRPFRLQLVISIVLILVISIVFFVFSGAKSAAVSVAASEAAAT